MIKVSPMKSLDRLFKLMMILFLRNAYNSDKNVIPNTKESEILLLDNLNSEIQETTSLDESKHEIDKQDSQKFDTLNSETHEPNHTVIISDFSPAYGHETFPENNEQLKPLNDVINNQINDCSGVQRDIGINIDEQGDVEDCFQSVGECCGDRFSSLGECCQGCFASVVEFIREIFIPIGEFFGSLGEGVFSLCEHVCSCCKGLGDCLGCCLECICGAAGCLQ